MLLVRWGFRLQLTRTKIKTIVLLVWSASVLISIPPLAGMNRFVYEVVRYFPLSHQREKELSKCCLLVVCITIPSPARTFFNIPKFHFIWQSCFWSVVLYFLCERLPLYKGSLQTVWFYSYVCLTAGCCMQGYLLSSTVDYLDTTQPGLAYTWILMAFAWIFPNSAIFCSHGIVVHLYRWQIFWTFEFSKMLSHLFYKFMNVPCCW